MRVAVFAAFLCLSSPAGWAGDGADSPEQIDKSTKQLAKVSRCSVQSGEIKFTPAPCTAKATPDKAANGATLWRFEYLGKVYQLAGTLSPENGKLDFAGKSTCAGKDKLTNVDGQLVRISPKVWQGDIKPEVRSALCGAFQLTIGK